MSDPDCTNGTMVSYGEYAKLRNDLDAVRAELQSIGEDFGVCAGEKHTAGIRRVLTNLREELAAVKADRDKEIDARLAVFRDNDALTAELAAERERAEQWIETAKNSETRWMQALADVAKLREALERAKYWLPLPSKHVLNTRLHDDHAFIDAVLKETGHE